MTRKKCGPGLLCVLEIISGMYPSISITELGTTEHGNTLIIRQPDNYKMLEKVGMISNRMEDRDSRGKVSRERHDQSRKVRRD